MNFWGGSKKDEKLATKKNKTEKKGDGKKTTKKASQNKPPAKKSKEATKKPKEKEATKKSKEKEATKKHKEKEATKKSKESKVATKKSKESKVATKKSKEKKEQTKKSKSKDKKLKEKQLRANEAELIDFSNEGINNEFHPILNKLKWSNVDKKYVKKREKVKKEKKHAPEQRFMHVVPGSGFFK